MAFLRPLALAAALVLPAIIVLYMLKKRTRPREISSTLLWEKLDRISTPALNLNKLLKNILLVLQLLTAALLVLALASPALKRVGGGAGSEAIIIIDTSYSMAVSEDGTTRLEQAVRTARSLIEKKAPGDAVGLIAMGGEARVLSGITTSKALLTKALDNLHVTGAQANGADALLLANNMASSLAEPQVIIISDGGLGEIDFRLDFPLNFVVVGQKEVANLLVEDMIVDGSRAYVTVANNGTRALAGTVTIRDAQGAPIGRRDFETLAPGTRQTLVWRSLPDSPWYQAQTGEGDQLAEDNVFFSVPNRGGGSRLLLVSQGNLFLERVLALNPGLRVSKTSPDRYRTELAGSYDFFVFDGFLPQELPAAPILAIDPPHPNPHFLTTLPTTLSGLRATQHPLLMYTDFREVSVTFSKAIPPGRSLLESDQGPVAAYLDNQGHPLVVLGFPLQAGDFALRPAFPIFMRNVLDHFTGYAVDLGRFRFGQSPVVEPPISTSRLTISSPSGKTQSSQGPFPWQGEPLLETGVYTVALDDIQWLTAVNFPKSLQSLAVKDTLDYAGEPLSGERRAGTLPLAAPLIVLALCLMGAEWWVDNRGF